MEAWTEMGTAPSSLGERRQVGGRVDACCDGFRYFSICSGYYFQSVGKLIQQLSVHGGGISRTPALSNVLLFLSLEGDPEHWEVEGKSSLGFRLLLSLALVR